MDGLVAVAALLPVFEQSMDGLAAVTGVAAVAGLAGLVALAGEPALAGVGDRDWIFLVE